MNIINLMIAQANNKPSGSKLNLTAHNWHIFDHTGEYKDYIELKNTDPLFLAKLHAKYKRCLFVRGYGHKDEWRCEWYYVKADNSVSTGIEFDMCSSDWHKVIDPKNRKPWYWERKISALKEEYPLWQTDEQEACNMRYDCNIILRELETNFNVNNNYYRIQANAAMAAHSIIQTCTALLDAYESNLMHMDHILNEREATGWTDEREDLHM